MLETKKKEKKEKQNVSEKKMKCFTLMYRCTESSLEKEKKRSRGKREGKEKKQKNRKT